MPQNSFAIAAIGQVALLAVFAELLLPCSTLHAEPVFALGFDGPETSWQVLDTGVESSLLTQECVAGGARGDSGAELMVVAAGNGQSAMLTCPVAKAVVIDELEVRTWVKSSRPGVQLAVRVVMPRSRDAQNRSSVTAIVRGASYDRPGRWQQLVLNDVPKLLAAEVRVMRSMPGARIDPREAYIDAVVLVVPGEPDGVEVVTDELAVEGIVRQAADELQLASFPEEAAPKVAQISERPPLSMTDSRRLPIATNSSRMTKPSPVRLQGSTLLVDDRPFLPRVVRWNGETMQFLSERGFNAVYLEMPPTAEQIAAAARHSVWFVSVPPRPDALARDGLGDPGDRVIAWLLQDDALHEDPNYAIRWAELVRKRDVVDDRPVIISPEMDWNAPSKTADILLTRHERISRIDGARFDHWLTDRSRATRPGTPLWASLASQFDSLVGRQVSAITGTTQPPPNVDSRRLESLLEIACTRGVRGFVFESHSSLSEADAATRRRAATLESINRRLQLIEPWLAGGKVTGRIRSSDGAWSGVVVHVDRARLLIPIAEQAEVESKTSVASAEIAFIIPGVPESCQVFALSPCALRTLPMQRVAGGTRVVLRSGEGVYVLMTEDPQVVQSVRYQVARDGAPFVRIERDRAALKAFSVSETDQRLARLGVQSDKTLSSIANVQSRLRWVDALLAAGRSEQALQLVESANAELDRVAADKSQSAVQTNLESSPLALSVEQLADHAEFQKQSAGLRGGENLLYGGDFEDLGRMTQVGWRHFRSQQPEIESRAELSADGAKHGGYCLELHASSASGTKPTATGAPVWIKTPAMAVAAGQLIEITGWVRVDESIDSADGLQIIDSLGGPALALAIRQTTGWQPFRLIRGVSESTELRLTFALTGLGSARLDALMVRALAQPTPRRLPNAEAGDKPPDSDTLEDTGPLFIAPQTP